MQLSVQADPGAAWHAYISSPFQNHLQLLSPDPTPWLLLTFSSWEALAWPSFKLTILSWLGAQIPLDSPYLHAAFLLPLSSPLLLPAQGQDSS